MARVSRLLAAGRFVAWYQEPLDFGPRSLGSRSILCDPSNRYARENINSYLLRRGIDEPLPVSVPGALAATCFEESVDSPFMLRGARVRGGCEDRLGAAISGARTCAVHTVDDAGHAGLRELLEVHHARTAVPGLINVGLCDSTGALAVTPRDAVRAAFGSAVDVLVLGRFIVSKDYWLLRSDGSGIT
jgi:carbamoyltransferase